MSGHARIRTSIGELADEFRPAIEATDGALDPARPVLIQVDGQAFHTLTRDLLRPFDDRFMAAMDAAAVASCTRVEGVRFAYAQSDEINLVLVNASGVQEPWFGYRTQKLASVAAAIATATFAREFWRYFPERLGDLPSFSARALNLADDEHVLRWMIWRQLDAVRNSVHMVARARFGHEAVVGLDFKQQLERLREIGSPWEALQPYYRLGRAVIRESYVSDAGAIRRRWTIDRAIPFLPETPEWVLGQLRGENTTDEVAAPTMIERSPIP